MTDTTDTCTGIAHSAEPWDCDASTVMYATPDETDQVHFIEVRANVTEDGWDTVAFVDAAWPGAKINARRICAAVNACRGISCEALEQDIVAAQQLVLQELIASADELLAAIQGPTSQFKPEHERFVAACTAARTVLDTVDEVDVHRLLARRDGIALIWSIEDVLELRPNLTLEQARKVLQKLERRHDAAYGINWDTLMFTADEMFGPPPEDEQS
jgi:hypothetical protein